MNWFDREHPTWEIFLLVFIPMLTIIIGAYLIFGE
jgi:hypothetical protein